MKETLIYLVENCYRDSNKVYIGKNRKGAISRKYKHIYKFGKDITLTFIDQINSWERKDWAPLETYWIWQFRTWGFETMNRNNGGGGTTKQSEETCLRKSKSMMGKKMSLETKQKMSLAKKDSFISPMKGKVQSKKWREIMLKTHKGRKISEETKQKMSLAQIGKHKIEGFGEKIRIVNSKSVIQMDLEGNFIKEYFNLTIAAKEIGVNISCITNSCRGKQKTSGGFKWKYK